MVIKNPEFNTLGRMIFFKFQNIIPVTRAIPTKKQLKAIPSVLIATSRVNTDDFISIHANTATINIEVDAHYLSELVDLPGKSLAVQRLLQNTQAFLFEQPIHPSLQKIVDVIVAESEEEPFELFFLRIKAEELICRLLMELEKRDEKRIFALRLHDIQTIYKVKDFLLEHPGTSAGHKELAVYANMNASKLKRVFKQIFGNSIFNYYQQFRMKEAARLLKVGQLSVTDVGHQMGYINLSHFSRAFEEHIGMKPKRYRRIHASKKIKYLCL
jgi:AraC-like DNA-binding protein